MKFINNVNFIVSVEKTTTELTNEYIKEHPHIQSCLKKGLINYSALSRLIAKELDIEKKTSKEAILIAARRFKEMLKKEITTEREIKELLSHSTIEFKNRITVFVVQKTTSFEIYEEMQNIRKEFGVIYVIEGSDHYVIITQEKYDSIITRKVKDLLIKKTNNLALVMLRSQKEIEEMRGVASFLTALLSENGINIVELLSCWTDTLFVVNSKDVSKTLQLLQV